MLTRQTWYRDLIPWSQCTQSIAWMYSAGTQQEKELVFLEHQLRGRHFAQQVTHRVWLCFFSHTGLSLALLSMSSIWRSFTNLERPHFGYLTDSSHVPDPLCCTETSNLASGKFAVAGCQARVCVSGWVRFFCADYCPSQNSTDRCLAMATEDSTAPQEQSVKFQSYWNNINNAVTRKGHE